MSTTKPTLIVSEVKNAFLALGEDGPPTNDPKEAAAWEFAIASELLRVAKLRKDKAQKAAVDAGALPDTTKEVSPPGTHEIVYDGAWVQLMLKVNQPTVTTDVGLFEKELRDRKVKQSVLDACKEAAQRVNKAPHQLTAVFRSSRGE